MPTRADIEAATPRCQARRYETGVVRVNYGLRGGMTEHKVAFLCLKPMGYRAADNTWVCGCGSVEQGAVLGARAQAFEIDAEAA